jgi:2-methylisocitrate lyase-like PEP mutase family enzyme
VSQKAKATLFRKLHRGPHILVLPNAWDAASARIFEDAGFPAIATTSGGVAAALGYPDGERTPRDEMVAAIGRIARAVKVPVTADIEAGYGRTPRDVAKTVAAVIRAGAAGINLEDGRHDGSTQLRGIDEQVARLRAARAAAASLGVPIVINARIDIYLREAGDPRDRLAETARRAKAYFAAGADCVFPIDFYDREVVRELVRAVAGPVNVIAGPRTPSIRELHRLGVARVSFGSGPMRAAMGAAQQAATELRKGSYAKLHRLALPGAELRRLFPAR